MTLKIWIDADACPNVIKDILFRAAERRQLPLVLVANRLIATPPYQFIKAVQVAGGFDATNFAARGLDERFNWCGIHGDFPVGNIPWQNRA
ncbi:MAG: DUF188 domain-containing protein [Methylococcales bacterium]|nr:DUF188 domain-containing protein [Methylococcales bacterium]